MWEDERKILAAVTSTLRSNWMETIKSSSNGQQQTATQKIAARINRSSPSINLTNSDDDDYTILPPSPPINRTPYSRVKGKARSKSSSRAQIVESSEEPSSMVLQEKPANYYSSSQEFSSFDCYQSENRKTNAYGNSSTVSNGHKFNGSSREVNNVIRRNRENIYEILTSKKLKDTQKTIKSLDNIKGFSDENNEDSDLSNDQAIEREWNKLVNGSTVKINHINNNNNHKTGVSLSPLPSAIASSSSTSSSAPSSPSARHDHHRKSPSSLISNGFYKQTKNHISSSLSSSSLSPSSTTNGTRFKEILQLYEDLGKSMAIDDDKSLSASNSKKDNANEVNQLKSTIIKLDNVCQSRLKGIEECHAKIKELRDEIKYKDEANRSLLDERNSLRGQLNDVQSAWRSECEERTKESARFNATTNHLMSRLKELNKELQESHINYDYLEMAYNRLKSDVKGVQELHEAELSLLKQRLSDLTTKLMLSEKSLKSAKTTISKLEARRERRRASTSSAHREKDLSCLSKDFHHKLQELEHKISRIQIILLANDHVSPDEGLPDIESNNSLPSLLNENEKTLQQQQIYEKSTKQVTSPTPTTAPTTTITKISTKRVAMSNSQQQVNVNNNNNNVVTIH